MITINDGGPAFPPTADMKEPHDEQAFPGRSYQSRDWWKGMSLRDWFAGQALAGILADSKEERGPDETVDEFRQACAEGAYCFADAMLAARKEGAK